MSQIHLQLELERDEIIDDCFRDGEAEGLLWPKAPEDDWQFDWFTTNIKTTKKNNDNLKISMFQGVRKIFD